MRGTPKILYTICSLKLLPYNKRDIYREYNNSTDGAFGSYIGGHRKPRASGGGGLKYGLLLPYLIL